MYERLLDYLDQVDEDSWWWNVAGYGFLVGIFLLGVFVGAHWY